MGMKQITLCKYSRKSFDSMPDINGKKIYYAFYLILVMLGG